MSKAPPPKLHFDDGSRIMQPAAGDADAGVGVGAGAGAESSPTSSSPSSMKLNPRGSTDVEIYYEIHRIAYEIVHQCCLQGQGKSNNGETNGNDHDRDHREFLCKVALQFPDELLDDAAEVCWLIEDEIMVQYKNSKKKSNSNKAPNGGLEIDNDDDNDDDDDIENNYHEETNNIPPLVFVLGDTTYSSCCPDEIGALHLDADVIVHYGQYACLSPPQCLPVIYSFGILGWAGLGECVQSVLQHISESGDDEQIKLLLLCERRYHQYMGKLSMELMKDDAVQEVIVGFVPIHNSKGQQVLPFPCDASESCCKERAEQIQFTNKGCCGNQHYPQLDVHRDTDQTSKGDGINIGGLRIPIDKSSLPDYTLLYVGDDSGTSKSRQFLNTILRCTSPKNQTKECWSYNPGKKQLSTDPSSLLGVSRYLNRRFYLTQKAQLAGIIGILVGTLSQDRFRTVISSVRQKILDSGRACYTFVVGKINVAKLANFAEIECFVLISCGETSVLQDEREFHVPVITPAELDIVLGEKVWGGSDSCNTDFGDFLKNENEGKKDDSKIRSVNNEDKDDENSEVDDEIEDDDEPFFSMISGTYISKPTIQRRSTKKGAEGRGGGGGGGNKPDSQSRESQMVEYKSDAAEFWKKREYKGLEAKIGQTEVKAAIEGQTGIASDYGK